MGYGSIGKLFIEGVWTSDTEFSRLGTYREGINFKKPYAASR